MAALNLTGSGSSADTKLLVKTLGRQGYQQIWSQMAAFTDARDETTPDELWLVEHDPVFTQGRAGKAEHVLELSDDIPLVHSDRGGQVTYHGPGQLVAYPLLDIKRLGLNVRELVRAIENSVIDLLHTFQVDANARADAPGVYVADKKIASLGLRVRRGKSFHGVAINVNMDLSPFAMINPCGYAGLQMTQLKDLIERDALPSVQRVAQIYAMILARCLGLAEHQLEYADGAKP